MTLDLISVSVFLSVTSSCQLRYCFWTLGWFLECEGFSGQAVPKVAYVLLNILNCTFLHLEETEKLFTFKSGFASTKTMLAVVFTVT